MPKKVFKYPCEPGTFTLDLPIGAEVLSVQSQSAMNLAEMWAMVDPTADLERRYFHTAGTGHPLPPTIKAFIGTFQMNNGAFVFHVFELEVLGPKED